jgi:uncharacterized RDD family membrane protein YckC
MTRVHPEEQDAERIERVRAAHLAAAARAQAAAAQRARANADARSSVPNWTEAERAGAYAGLVTRTIAYCLDIAVINLVAFLTGAAVALAGSFVGGLPEKLQKLGVIVGGVAYVLWVIGYFATFWSTNGQTPGSRVMRIRVTDALGGSRVSLLRSVVRVGGLVLATIPLFAGFWIMLWDDRGRCLQDRLARTTVVHAPPQARIVRQAIPREPD